MRLETTAISALLKVIARDRFARLVEAHRSDRGTRRLRSW